MTPRRDTLDWTTLRAGDALPPLEIALTPTMVVAGAIASRDFMPVHHDRDYAALQGAPNIFTNILTDNGLCSRFLTDWAGPEAMVRRLAIRLGTPAHPGMTLVYTGTVTGLAQADGEGIVEIAFRCTVESGEHLSGTAVVALPLRAVPA